jgi:hypothetical protein
MDIGDVYAVFDIKHSHKMFGSDIWNKNHLEKGDVLVYPVPYGVTVSCERYTVGFPVCYGSQNHHECKEGERSGRW